MSESVASPATPGVPEPGPASGTTPVVAETAAPAAFSPETTTTETPAAVTEPAQTDTPAADAAEATEVRPSLLSELTAEKPAEEEPAKAEGEKPAEAQAEPPAAPTYDKFTLPEGVTLAEEKIGAFTGILGEFEQKVTADPKQAHVAAQEMGQKLVDFYLNEAREATERQTRFQHEVWNQTREGWLKEFREDPDMGGNRQNTTLARMGGLMDLYGQQAGPDRLQKLRDVFTATGAGDNPEVLRFVNWAATRLTETSRVVTPMLPRAPVAAGASRAARLYRNTNGAA